MKLVERIFDLPDGELRVVSLRGGTPETLHPLSFTPLHGKCSWRTTCLVVQFVKSDPLLLS